MKKEQKKITAGKPQLSIGYNDPRKFQFKPPGVRDPDRYTKGAKPKFERKPVVSKEDLDPVSYAEGLVDFLLDQHFSIAVAISNLKGTEEVEWTKCYHTRCRVLADQFRREECKLDCQKRALNVLISKLGGLRGKCRFERNPAGCAQRVNDEVKAAREKLIQIRQTTTTVKRSKTTYKAGTEPAGGAARR